MKLLPSAVEPLYITFSVPKSTTRMVVSVLAVPNNLLSTFHLTQRM